MHVKGIVVCTGWEFNIGTCTAMNRVHAMELNAGAEVEAFPLWLRERCSDMADGGGGDLEELRALSRGPSRRVCSFRSMTSFGSHYRVEGEGGGPPRHL